MDDDVRAWEQRLVARLQAGDDEALAVAFDQYGPLVHGIARRLVGAATASDVTQDVFAALWDHPDRFDPFRGSLRTFLALLARRKSIDVLRSSGRRSAHETVAGSEPVRACPNVDEAAIALLDADRVKGALASLPPDQRRAIELAYFEGLTFREVAAATSVSEGTAKSRIRLGLRRLAESLRSHMTMETA